MKICQSLNWVSSYTSHICQRKQTQCKYLLYVICCIWNNFKCSKDGWRRECDLNLIVCPFILLFEKRYTITFMQIAHSILLQLYYAPNYCWFWKKKHTLWITVSKTGQVILFLDYRDQEILVDNTTQRDLLNLIENTVSTRKIGKSIPPHFNIKWYLFFQ